MPVFRSPMPLSPAPAMPPARETLAVGVATAVLLLAAMLPSERPWTLRDDNSRMFLPLTVEAVRLWSRGTIPHWTDGVWSGYPLIGDPTAGAFYLPNLPIVWAAGEPPVRAFDITFALHLGLLVAGAYRLLGLLGAGRPARLVGALLTLLTPFPHWTGMNFVPVTAAYAWWPWALGAAEELARASTPRFGRALVAGWIAIAAQVLLGMPEQMLYCALLVAAWLLTRRGGLGVGERCLRLGLLGVGAAALAAPQLLPTVLYLPTTVRGQPPEMASFVALYLTRPVQLVVPGLGQLNGIASFYGLATLVAAGIGVASRAPRAGFLATAAGVAFLLALGDQTPAYQCLRSIPPFGYFRSPIKFQAIVELALVWCAALGVDAIGTWRRRRLRVAVATLAALAVAEHAAYMAEAVATFRQQRARERDDVAVLRTLEESRVLRRQDDDPPPLVLDTWGRDPSRGETYVTTFAGGLSTVAGMSSLVGGGTALLGRRHAELLAARSLGRAAIELFGARYVLSRRPACMLARAGLAWPVVEWTASTCVLENPSRPQRFALLGAARAVEDEAAMVELVRRDPAGPVPVVAGEVPLPPAVERRADTVTVQRWAPDESLLTVRASHDGLLLVRQSWVPGWSATVGGVPAPVLPAAGVFFVVPVPAGTHEVHLRYRTPGLVLGTGIAALWTAAVVLVAATARRSRAGSSAGVSARRGDRAA